MFNKNAFPQVEFVDVVCFNRYYSWYHDFGHYEWITLQLQDELVSWRNSTGKLVLMTEYGADAISGLHQVITFTSFIELSFLFFQNFFFPKNTFCIFFLGILD